MKNFEENCGIFGICSPEPCVQDIYQGIDFLQHRGQQYCGIATYGDEGILQVTHYGKVANTMTKADIAYLKGRSGIGHVSLKERQPVMWRSRLGEVALAFSGNIINARELMQELMERGNVFYKGYHIEIISMIIMNAGDLASGIASLAERIKGAYCLVVLAQEGIYAARDTHGFRPLCLGRGEGRFAVSSESRALHNLEMELVRDVRPGEIVLVSPNGFKTLKQLPSSRPAYCAFEWAYTASIDSLMDGVYVQEARNRIGAKLAQRDREEGGFEADIVAPVPMSGIGHAIGYHIESSVPYQEVFLYNRYADRSYTQSTQMAREQMAKRKLSVLRYAVKGKRIVLCDDSIVRGTQILHKVKDLKEAGASEVHVRVACPPLMYPCDFGISTRSYDELAARKYIPKGNISSLDELRGLESWVAENIGADSVKYNTLEDFVSALGLGENTLCLKCWNGMHPSV